MKCLSIAIMLAALACAQPPALDVVFVLDVSPATMNVQRQIAAGSRLAAQELAAADRVAVISVARDRRIHTPLTSDAAAIVSAFHKATNWRNTQDGKLPLYDALLGAVEMFPSTPDPGRRPIVVLVTQNADRGSKAGDQAVIAEAKRRGVRIHVAAIPSLDPHLGAIAEATGGQCDKQKPSGYILRQLVAGLKGDTH